MKDKTDVLLDTFNRDMEKIFKYRCFARPEYKSGLYYSACIDLNISSCGDTLAEAVESLNEQIEEFVEYAIEKGRFEDLNRPAPLRAKIDYYFVGVIYHLGRLWYKSKQGELKDRKRVGTEVFSMQV